MANAPDPLPPEVLAAFERRQPIEAIKLLFQMRANSRSGKKPAAGTPPKAGAALAADPDSPSPQPNASPDGLSPGEVPRSESAIWGLVVVVLVIYLAYRILGR